MDRESFEDIISKKYEGKAVKAPKSVWDGVQHSLDADLLVLHKERSSYYRMVAIAAILLAFLSFGFLLLDRVPEPNTEELSSFNALRGDVPEIEAIYTPKFPSMSKTRFSVVYLEKKEDDAPDATDRQDAHLFNEDSEQSIFDYSSSIALKSLGPDILLAENQDWEIHRYQMVPRTVSTKQQFASSVPKVWAGVEAGAGAFNGNLSSSQTLASAVNNANLASSAGLSDFVNPTNTVNQNSTAGTARSIGFDLGMEVGKRWTVESGFFLNSMQHSSEAAINVLDVYTVETTQFRSVPSGIGGLGTEGVSAADRQVEVRESFDTEVRVESRVQFASVPVKAGYFLIRRKFSLRLNAGLAANYLLEGGINDPSNQIFSDGNSKLYNDWSFDGLSGLEFGISLFDNFAFTLEPNYRYAIVPVTESSTASNRFMVQTGLRYRIQ